jgi:hypothetical protein
VPGETIYNDPGRRKETWTISRTGMKSWRKNWVQGIQKRLDDSVRNVDNLMADNSTKMSAVLLGYFEADQSMVEGDLESRKLRVWILVNRRISKENSP